MVLRQTPLLAVTAAKTKTYGFVLLIGLLLGGEATLIVQQPPTNIWVYSLVASDHENYKLLPHFLMHYSGLGVPLSKFYFDIQHDPMEGNFGLRVGIIPQKCL